MSPQTIGAISGAVVIVSAIPYAIRVYQRKIEPQLTSWSLWTLIGLALLVTYKSSGAEANVWPAVFGFTNPLVITLLVLRQRGTWTRPNRFETACLLFGLVSLGLWLAVRESRELSQYALYLAIVADLCAAVPTFTFVWNRPDGDRPFAWICFGIGYALGVFAITEHTVSNYALPIYMACGSWSIGSILALHRWRKNIPLAEWI